MSHTQTRGCTHIAHAEGYHELVWYDSSLSTVDEYIAHVARIYTELPADTHLIRWLVRDAGTAGLPSVNYFSNRVRELERRFPDRPNTRAAILYGKGIKLLLLNAMITLTNLRGRDTTRFFPLDGEAEARAWLLAK
jgi:hypothetical protein